MTLRKVLFVMSSMAVLLVASSAMAQDGAVAASTGDGIGKLGAALAVSIAAFGGALGQGKTAATALEGIARNPAASDKIFTPMIIGLALIESLVLYGFVIAFVKY